jgi:hypothetical protein
MSNDEIFDALAALFGDWYESAKLRFDESVGIDNPVEAAKSRGRDSTAPRLIW